MSVFKYEKDQDGIVTITMDMTGPVNAVNEEFEGVMSETVARLEDESDLSGVVFASAKQTFFAGGDLNVILAMQPGQEKEVFDNVEKLKDMFRRLEKLPVPVVAAINGAALGGGFELCLSCNHRIAWEDKSVEIGLPEVQLGLMPGAGGVVRLTHLLGLQGALPFLLEAKKVRGAKAKEVGFVHETVAELEQLVPRAKAWILENKDDPQASIQPWDSKGHKIPGGNIMNPKIAQVALVAPQMLRQKARGLMPAPESILETAVEAITSGFDAAQRVESRKFAALATSPQAKNMISTLFFQLNEVNAGSSRPQGIDTSKVKKVGVIGAGMMGQGIAYVAAKVGIEVVLKDMSMEAAEKGKAYSEKLLDKAISRGRSDETKKAQLLNLIHPTDKNEDLAGCDLVVEAVFEDMGLKHKITKDLEPQLADGGVWASNTSSLPITQLAEASDKPENFIGLHFFSPVDKMPLVEIICGDKTSDETLAKGFDFVQQIKKTPIVVNDKVGFFTGRAFAAQLNEAAQMLSDGIDPIRIDNLGKAVGMPIGPLAINDEVSLSLLVKVRKAHLESGLIKLEDDKYPEAWALRETLVHEYNRGGRYHGDGGYFDYTDEGKVLWPKLREMYFKPEVNEAVDNQDIKDRLLFSCVIETLNCLEEGVLRTVADANIGSIFGIGAPPWTGGYLQFINTYGLERFINRCDELSERYGDRFKAPAMVAEKLAAGELFN
ncbi:MAG: 3-hydroxyacyl-CoA dehydrogenase NAD-binding domain-containing protein [Candidatus Pelagadaptatus aseana]|uniref:3-hydroxyacyl-CoA dehydrogenase NAD-binding domain-containing protein n=1 Tax=Candidatus Pelagadaptatus aseana TaxID=3120508 RepID=UPI0039B17EB8